MLEEFVGRSPELEVLNKAYAGKKSAFYPVYGRRRVGKTELILRFTEDKPSVFYLGKQATTEYQVGEFLEIAAEKLNEPLLAQLGEVGWKKALQLVVERTPKGEKLVIVLDEYQWITETSPELPSILQELWDLDWSRSGKVMLILCGSYIGFMEREVLGSKSPLYGRRTGQIQLQPFGFRDAAKFHPNYSRADQARVWSLCGGIPYYLQQYDDRKSVAMNVRENFLTPHAALFRESDFLLREELREVETYHGILMTLSTGALSAADLARKSSISSASIQYYLKTLMELGYIGKSYPLSGKKPTARSVRYLITDPLLRFWFRFGFRNLSRIVSVRPAAAYDKVVAPHIEAYYGERFEKLCHEAISEIYLSDDVAASHEVGEYWDKDVQIDLLSLRDDEFIDVGECKWGTVRSWPAAVKEAKAKAAAFPNPLGRTLAPWLFTRLKPKAGVIDGVRCVGVDELYGPRS